MKHTPLKLAAASLAGTTGVRIAARLFATIVGLASASGAFAAGASEPTPKVEKSGSETNAAATSTEKDNGTLAIKQGTVVSAEDRKMVAGAQASRKSEPLNLGCQTAD